MTAVIRFVESVAEEHRIDGITANSIFPGAIDSMQNRVAIPNALTDIWVKSAAIAQLKNFWSRSVWRRHRISDPCYWFGTTTAG